MKEEFNDIQWNHAAEVCADELIRGMANERPHVDSESDAFLQRHRLRWSGSLLIVEAFLQSTTYLGSEINQGERPAAVERNDAKFEALVRNHARAIQVAREVFVLASNGYATGALSRWRTLHELAVVCLFLHRKSPEASERYLLHDVVESRDSAREHLTYRERLLCDAPTATEMAELDDRVSALAKRFGPRYHEPNGWALGYLDGLKPNARVSFFAIEKYVGLDHWRPRYKLASQAVHSPSKSAYWSLSAGLMHNFLLVGAAGEGLADVLHPLMISLNVITSCLVTNWPNEKRAVLMQALVVLQRRGGETLLSEHAHSKT